MHLSVLQMYMNELESNVLPICTLFIVSVIDVINGRLIQLCLSYIVLDVDRLVCTFHCICVIL